MLSLKREESEVDITSGTWPVFVGYWIHVSAMGSLFQINVHGYQQGNGRRDLLYDAVNGTRLWNSEYGEGDVTGLSLAANLNLDFIWLHNTAWVYWQVKPSHYWCIVAGSGSIS